jgi:hypothetical protein
MARTLSVCALLTALLVAVLLAPPAPAAPGPVETVVTLTVHPAAAPRPALKYQLLPELREMSPGNPVPAYLKCFMEQQNFFFNKDVVAEREQFLTMPLDQLPVERVMRMYGGRGPLRQADEAARLDRLDWQILPTIKRDGINTLLPEIQQLRSLASALKVRFRAEVAARRFDDAVVTAKTMFALARHLGEHPSLVANLVGIAIANIATGPLEEMMQQPGCPNLYWALADLPSPFIDVRKGVQGDRLAIDATLAGLDPETPMSEAQLRKLVARVVKDMDSVGGIRDVAGWLDKRARDDAHVRAARGRLAEAGVGGKALAEFPPLQVVLLDEKLAFEVRRDEVSKWMTLPHWEARQHLDAPRDGDEHVFYSLLSAYDKIRKAQLRLEQRLALLRHVEAVRLYAAAHGGKVPEQLSEIGLPLPVDPFTGKPFVYTASGQTAGIKGSPPKGEEDKAVYNVRFLVTVKP